MRLMGVRHLQKLAPKFSYEDECALSVCESGTKALRLQLGTYIACSYGTRRSVIKGKFLENTDPF